jgi:two-component system nitrate/nitrite response regulator NarL
MIRLTQREYEIWRLVTAGHPNKEIARQAGITEFTVKVHVKTIFKKFGVSNRTELAAHGFAAGLVPLPLCQVFTVKP